MDGGSRTQNRRMRKEERHEQILLELKLRPHVRIAEMADRFGVSTETVRRDMDDLSEGGLINRAHGGATSSLHYPDFNQRSRDRQAEREAIGKAAATLVKPGDTVMIDSGSTTVQFARFLTFARTPCTVITNSLNVAVTLGHGDSAKVILCPGDYLASEAAVVGTDTVGFLARHRVDHCMIGASGIDARGISEMIRGFAAVKRAMLDNANQAHLLIDSGKFDRAHLARVGRLGDLSTIVLDRAPGEALTDAINAEHVKITVAADKAT